LNIKSRNIFLRSYSGKPYGNNYNKGYGGKKNYNDDDDYGGYKKLVNNYT
jgi:hypothetical protein